MAEGKSKMNKHGVAALMMMAALTSAGCGTTQKQGELVLAEVAAMLSGSYDNLAQSRQAGAEHAPLRLMIAPVEAPVVGEHVYYVQEFAAQDERRVFAQRLYILIESADPLHPLLAQYDFTESTRWRDGYQRRELFRGLLPQDLRRRAGCELRVERSDTGFKLNNDPKACRMPASGTGETLYAEQRIELNRDGVALLDIRRDASGAVMQGGESDPGYRVVRRADAPW
jgi:hypothetical protein